jgi:hypothetical protein
MNTWRQVSRRNDDGASLSGWSLDLVRRLTVGSGWTRPRKNEPRIRAFSWIMACAIGRALTLPIQLRTARVLNPRVPAADQSRGAEAVLRPGVGPPRRPCRNRAAPPCRGFTSSGRGRAPTWTSSPTGPAGSSGGPRSRHSARPTASDSGHPPITRPCYSTSPSASSGAATASPKSSRLSPAKSDRHVGALIA